MKQLLKDIQAIKESKVGKHIDSRLAEFSSFQNRGKEDWFSELCFCILTSNSKSSTSCNIQKSLGYKGFISLKQEELAQAIRNHKHRFHNTKAKYIVEARKHKNIREHIKPLAEKSQIDAREWLVANVKGYGYKEASHFLRNTGFFDLAVLDRHIINHMQELGVLMSKPKTLTKRTYLEVEHQFRRMAKQAKMSCGELDFYMWYMKAGEVLK